MCDRSGDELRRLVHMFAQLFLQVRSTGEKGQRPLSRYRVRRPVTLLS